MAATATMTIRVTPEQRSTIADVAATWGKSISEYVRDVVLERIEDEYDIRVGEEAYEEWLRDPVTISSDELEAKYL